MNIISYNELLIESDKLVHKIASSNLHFDAVVPALRSGMIPAFKIAERLNLPIMINEELFGGRRLKGNFDAKSILLVDDSINTGNNLISEIKKYEGKYNIFAAAVFSSEKLSKALTFYSKIVDQPRIFEWNMFNSFNTNRVMFDMDGVICIDPRVFDDDGDLYESEIKHIPTLFLPKYPVHSIVTNRLEKWRHVTETWLKDHGVAFGQLVMQQFPTASARRAASNPGVYKAEVYSASDAALFIESDLSQAKTIARLSQKPVYCIENNSFIHTDTPQSTQASSKLEIGPGQNRISDDWVTIGDFERPGIVDHVCKWGSERLPFNDDTFETIYASHCLEHVPWFEIDFALSECHRILKRAGSLEIHVPDIEYLFNCYKDKSIGDKWIKHNNQEHPVMWLASRLFSYGPTSSNYHKSCFDFDLLSSLLKKHGFSNIIKLNSSIPHTTHGPINLGVRAFKV